MMESMNPAIPLEFLDPKAPLVHEVTGWLCGNERYSGRVRIEEGARSLAHIMVVVPTAQSGRTLRLELAKEAMRRGWHGIMPPQVVQPIQLIKSAQMPFREATTTEVAAAFQQYVKHHRDEILALDRIIRSEVFDDLTARFSLLDQLEDIWHVLAGRGWLMGDVVALAGETLAEDVGDELKRWQQLSQLEAGFFAYLHERGLAYKTEIVHQAKENPAAIDDAVEEIVVPALADPIRVFEDVLMKHHLTGGKITVLLHAKSSERDWFDQWGCPITERWCGKYRPILERLENEDIFTVSNTSALARQVAADFPSVEDKAKLPALGLCDDTVFQGLSAAFLNRGYEVHNPERYRLGNSSLGRLMKNLLALYLPAQFPWKEFVGFFRCDDTLKALGLSDDARADVLAGLDIVRNNYLPIELPADANFPDDPYMRDKDRKQVTAFLKVAREVMQKVYAFRVATSPAEFLRCTLRWLFAKRPLSKGTTDKEFIAAATATRTFLDALSSPIVTDLQMTSLEQVALAYRELENAVYVLEPDSHSAIRTEGWLELAWSAADQLALVGLHEGKVPDSVVGHPFLPDSLRRKLGLISNADRLARDSWLLKELLTSHAVHSVRIYVARASDTGDICRPSRLLYLCADAELPGRTKHLYEAIPEIPNDRTRRVDWQMNLPDTLLPPQYFSPSALDSYIACPFSYLLRRGLGMEPYVDKNELNAADFGTLVHAALETYAKLQIARGDDQLVDATEIRRVFTEEICPALRAKYGTMTLNVELQFRALEGRLGFFADMQSAWAAAGWRIRKSEQEISTSLEIPELGFRIHGFIDRVDENIYADEACPWCVIDYKTWDKKTLNGRVVTTNRLTARNQEQLAFAAQMGFPVICNQKQEACQRVLSVQLPIYGKCLAALDSHIPFSAIQYRYFIMAATAEECEVQPLKHELVDVSIETAKRAVERIKGNVFWPPGPNELWQRDFGGLFTTDPVSDLAESEWVRQQVQRLEQVHD